MGIINHLAHIRTVQLA